MSSSINIDPDGNRASMRHLLEPPLDCRFGLTSALLTDISVSGVRLCHWHSLEGGSKANLEFEVEEGRLLTFEGLVVWSHAISNQLCGDYSSGLKMIADPQEVGQVIESLVKKGLTKRIAENRRSNRFLVQAPINGRVDQTDVRICDLSSTGVRIESSERLPAGDRMAFAFELPKSDFVIKLTVEVVWSYLTAIWSDTQNRYSSGLRAVENPGMMRAAIGHLSDLHFAEKDVRSLALKSRLENYEIPKQTPDAGIDRESGGRVSLVRSVRRALKERDAAAIRWFDRAKQISQQPDIRGVAGPIAQDVEALAVWEFLDRRIDPSLIALGFQ